MLLHLEATKKLCREGLEGSETAEQYKKDNQTLLLQVYKKNLTYKMSISLCSPAVTH